MRLSWDAVDRMAIWSRRQVRIALFSGVDFVCCLAIGIFFAWLFGLHLDAVLLPTFFAYIFNNRSTRIK